MTNMALAEATITYDLSDMVGADFNPSYVQVWVTTNVPGGAVADTVGNAVRIGDGMGTLAADGTGSLKVWIPGAGSNPASWQTYIHVSYSPRRDGWQPVQRTFGPFTVTGNASLADLITEQEVPPTYLTTVTAELQGYVDSAEAAAVDANDAAVAGKALSIEPDAGDDYQVTGDDVSVMELLPGRSGPTFVTRSTKLLVTVSCVAIAPGGVLIGAAIRTGPGSIPLADARFSYVKCAAANSTTVLVALDCTAGDTVEVVPVMSSPFAESFVNVGPASPFTDPGYGPVSIFIQQVAA